jgi:hypothetical protein
VGLYFPADLESLHPEVYCLVLNQSTYEQWSRAGWVALIFFSVLPSRVVARCAVSIDGGAASPAARSDGEAGIRGAHREARAVAPEAALCAAASSSFKPSSR